MVKFFDLENGSFGAFWVLFLQTAVIQICRLLRSILAFPLLLEEDCATSQKRFRLLSGKWGVLMHFGAIFDVNLFLMIKKKFTSKVAYCLKFLPFSCWGTAIVPSPP